MAPPAHADVVSWGLDRVKQDKIVLEKAEKHQYWATRNHYHVVGLHRWLLEHLKKQQKRHQMQRALQLPASSASVIHRLSKRLARTEYKLKTWGKVRVRLARKVHYKHARMVGMKQWVDGVIARRAAAQAKRAQEILAAIARNDQKATSKKVGDATPGDRAVQAALTQLGVPYVWGGETPGKAFDCSGLVQWAWAQEGVSLVHFAATQATEGTPVAIADLQPGDLVFFEHPIGHVAMYVGGGILIEAPQTGDVVKLTHLDDSWHVANYVSAVRPG